MFQHAEHYSRILALAQENAEQRNNTREEGENRHDNGQNINPNQEKNELGSNQNTGVLDNIKKSSLFNNIKQNNQKISIDEAKFVTKIDTNNLEKKYSSLGDTKTSQENISSSINKLKSMKG